MSFPGCHANPQTCIFMAFCPPNSWYSVKVARRIVLCSSSFSEARLSSLFLFVGLTIACFPQSLNSLLVDELRSCLRLFWGHSPFAKVLACSGQGLHQLWCRPCLTRSQEHVSWYCWRSCTIARIGIAGKPWFLLSARGSQQLVVHCDCLGESSREFNDAACSSCMLRIGSEDTQAH